MLISFAFEQINREISRKRWSCITYDGKWNNVPTEKESYCWDAGTSQLMAS